MNMIITTQANCPFPIDNDDLSWIPCIKSELIDQQYRFYLPGFDYIICTNQLAWDFWIQQDRKEFPTIITVGKTPNTYLPENAKIIQYESADDIQIEPNKLYAWIHGDKYKRDFSKYDNVRYTQTYSSRFDQDAVWEVARFKPEELYVYTQNVLTAIEECGNFETTKLYHTKSCTPNKSLWKEPIEFYPGYENYRKH